MTPSNNIRNADHPDIDFYTIRSVGCMICNDSLRRQNINFYMKQLEMKPRVYPDLIQSDNVGTKTCLEDLKSRKHEQWQEKIHSAVVVMKQY